jgi:glutathione synthase/RimK-type ligase-like ATP-grasp enzyme
MKDCFKELKVPQATWWPCMADVYDAQKKGKLEYPIVIKRVFGFQGKGMSLISNEKELNAWHNEHPGTGKGDWFAETFYYYSREYRLHVAASTGVFLSWRKLRTKKAKDRWFFNSINSNWVGEQHELFDRPSCWKAMEKAACDALKATGLDIGAVDIRVQSNKQTSPKFIVCEINSAPALGDLGVEKYKEVITKLINTKANAKHNL